MSEAHSLRGPVDRSALVSIRDLVAEQEPLAAPELDDVLDPTVLEVTLDDGIQEAETARIDIQWTTRDDYKFHYTDASGVDARWGRHPHDGDYVHAATLDHFHPPPDASTDPSEVEASCIEESTPLLVTRAVLKLWRVAYHAGSLAALNGGSNPP